MLDYLTKTCKKNPENMLHFIFVHIYELATGKNKNFNFYFFLSLESLLLLNKMQTFLINADASK